MLSITGINAGQAETYHWKGHEESYYEKEGDSRVLAGFDGKDQATFKDALDIVRERQEQTANRGNNRDEATQKFAEDLTFSADKTISLAWAIGSETIKKEIEQALDQAVQDTMDTLIEQGFIQSRDSHGQPTTANKESIHVISFTHHFSRDHDPQLHVHVLILNSVERQSDGQLTATYLKEIYDHKKDIGAMFQGFLGKALQEKGFEIDFRRIGSRNHVGLKGFSEETLKEFSKRRQEIQNALDEKGLDDGKSAEIVALETRNSKQILSSEEQDQILQKIKSYVDSKGEGFVKNDKAKPMDPVQEMTAKTLAEKTLADKITIDGLVSPRDGLVSIARNLRDNGLVFSKDELHAQMDNAVHTLGEQQRGITRLKDGSLTTNNTLNAEIRSQVLFGHERFALDAESVKESLFNYNFYLKLNSGFSLSEKQNRIVQSFLSSSHDGVIQGYAGAGKTTLLKAMKEVTKKLGHEVYAIAPSGAAADKLGRELGTRAYTADGLVYTRDDEIKKQSLMIVDEASMMSSRQMAAVLEKAHKSDSKVLLVGDDNQLKAVGHGDAFKALKLVAQEKGSYFVLDEVHRQKDETYRRLATMLRPDSGKAPKALMEMKEKGWIHEVSRSELAVKVAQDYLKKYSEGKEVLAVTDTNALKDTVNKLIRDELIQKGEIQTENSLSMETKTRFGENFGVKEFAPGDKVMFRENDKNLHVNNGQTGRIVWIEDKKIGIETQNRTVTVDTTNFQALDHAYAVTIHKSQGQDVDHVVIGMTGSRMLDGNLMYVAATRGKESMQIYTDSFERLQEKATTRREKLDLLKAKTGANSQVIKNELNSIRENDGSMLRLNLPNLQDLKAGYWGYAGDQALLKDHHSNLQRNTWLSMTNEEKKDYLKTGNIKTKILEEHVSAIEIKPDEKQKDAVNLHKASFSHGYVAVTTDLGSDKKATIRDPESQKTPGENHSKSAVFLPNETEKPTLEKNHSRVSNVEIKQQEHQTGHGMEH